MATRDHGLGRLRARREQLGLTLEQIQADTRIPLAYLEALEQGRLEALPEGPWRQAYVREYRTALGLDPETGAFADPEISPPRVPLWVVRLVAGVTCLALLGGIAWQLSGRGLPASTGAVAEPPPIVLSPPDQRMWIRAERRAHVRVLADGEVAADQTLAPGEVLEIEARDRIEIDVPAAEAVRLRWNDQAVAPQGRQDEPRRLVFVDDLGSGR